MRSGLKVSVFFLSLWCVLFIISFAVCSDLTLIKGLEVVLVLTSLSLIGSFLLSFTKFANTLSAISLTSISIFIGSLFCSFLLFFIPHTILLPVITGLGIATVLFRRSGLSAGLSSTEVLVFGCSFAIFVLIFFPGGYAYVNSELIITKNAFTDPYYFTSLVASIRKGTIYNAVYESGTSLNYHSLGFFIPAMYAELFGISSFQALWSLTMPFYILLGISLSYELAAGYCTERKVFGLKWVFVVLAVSLPFILSPLHPLYVWRHDFRNIIYNGIPYLFPGGNVPTTFSLCLFYVSFIIFSRTDWTENCITDKLMFVIITAFMAVSKIPFYFQYGTFILTIVVIRLLFRPGEKVRSYLLYAVLLAVLSLVLMKVFITDSNASKTYFKFGYFINMIAHLQFVPANQSTFKLLVITFLILMGWVSIRFIGFLSALFSKELKYTELAIGASAAFVISILFSLFLHIDYLDANGKILVDGTPDIEQFIRASYYIITIVAMIGTIRLLNSPIRQAYKSITVILLVFWAGCTLLSIVYNHNPNPMVKVDWYEANISDLKKGRFDKGLILVNPYSEYGCVLSATDHGKFWTAMAKGKGLYNNSLANAYRWHWYDQLKTEPSAEILNKLKAEGVRYIIATPYDEKDIFQAAIKYPEIIKRDSSNHWIYEMN